jgi:hypothetical protein
MLIAPNVVAHDPEKDLTKIDSNRLRQHGWPASAIEFLDKVHSGHSLPVPDSKSLDLAASQSSAPKAEEP